jgi:hypothetical protein
MYVGSFRHSGFDSLLIPLHITHVRPSSSLANQQLKHLKLTKKIGGHKVFNRWQTENTRKHQMFIEVKKECFAIIGNY